MTARISDDELLAELDAASPAWVITGTPRLARELGLRIARLRAARGQGVFETPAIRSLDEWLETLGRKALSRESSVTPGRTLLSRTGERLLWERVISAAPGDIPSRLLDLPALAATAAEAWKRVCLWGNPELAGPFSEDVEAFHTWMSYFRARLSEHSLATSAELPAIVANAIGQGLFDDLCPSVAIVLGFERVDPALTSLTTALRSQGTVLRLGSEESVAPANPVVLRAGSRAVEVRFVAARVRERLLEDPSLRVAVLAPELASYGTLIERIFEEELDPAGVLDVDGSAVRRFDFAEAQSLASYPLVAGALDLLSLDSSRLSFDAVSRLLLFAWPRPIAAAEGEDVADCERAERAARGAFEAQLRRSRAARLRLAGGPGSLAAEAEELAEKISDAAEGQALRELAKRLAALSTHIASQRGVRRTPSAWRSEWVKRLEDVIGWPGGFTSESERILYRQDWRDAMEAFARLEIIEPTMGEAQAIAQLRSICDAPAKPRTAGHSVKVMNLLDAAGLDFDVVYVIGMTAGAFPASLHPNPLLPVVWQRTKKGMPRASVEGERELADAVWRRVMTSAPEVIVTWPATGESGEENTPSSLVARIESVAIDSSEGEPWWLGSARRSSARESRPPENVPPPLVRRGGSSILTNQASCAFRAFLVTRLGAEKLADVKPQPDAARRGTLVHSALVRAYDAVPSANELRGLSEENIRDLARDVARSAVREDPVFFEDAADLEEATRAWLEELVAGWLVYERAMRNDSWTVESMERKYTLALPADVAEPLTIEFRPDRIDRTGNGIAILDFKTSGTAKKQNLWAGDRPDEPQLPLYLALLEQDGASVEVLAFANLAARDASSLEGIATEEIGPDCKPPSPRQKSFPPDFHLAVASMRESIEKLARDYLAGVVTVDPKTPKVCEYCGGRAFCRVVEGGGTLEDDAAEEPE